MEFKAQQKTYITNSVKGTYFEKDEIKTPTSHYYIRVRIKGEILYYGTNGEWVDFKNALKLSQKNAFKTVSELKKQYKSAELFSSTL